MDPNFIAHLLEPLRTSLALLFSRGLARMVDDSEDVQTMQVDLGEGEPRDDVEHLQSYGVSMHCPGVPELVTLSQGGQRSHVVAIVAHARGTRPKNLEAGEVVIYDDLGKTILLKRDGTIVISGASEVIVNGDVTATGDVAAGGDVSDSHGTLEQLRTAYNNHTHPGVTTGPGNTLGPLFPDD